MWSDETYVEPFDLKQKHNVSSKSSTAQHPGNTVIMIKHGVGSIMLQGCFSARGSRKHAAITGNVDQARYKQIVEEHLFQSARHVPLWQKCICSNRAMSQNTVHKNYKGMSWVKKEGLCFGQSKHRLKVN